MAYDPALHKSVMYGGATTSADGSQLADVWTFDGSTKAWSHLADAPADVGARSWAQFDFDPRLPTDQSSPAGRILLFGGTKRSESTSSAVADTWTFDGTTWTQATATTPPARYAGGMVYDPNAHEDVLVGGIIPNGSGVAIDNQTWRFDGAIWTPATGIASPTGISYIQLAYDPSDDHQSGSFFGGWDGSQTRDRYWAYSHKSIGVAVSLHNPTTTTFTVGQVAAFDVALDNPSAYPTEEDGVTVTLPAGLSTSPITVLGPGGSPCTASSTPACRVSSSGAGDPTLTIDGIEMSAGAVSTYVVYATVGSVLSGAPAASCPADGGGLNGSYYAAQVQQDHPLDYWRLDDGTSSTTAKNLGSAGVDASYYKYVSASQSNLEAPTAIPGSLGDGDGAKTFTSDHYVSIGATPASSDFTLETWVRPSVSNSDLWTPHPIFSLASNTSDANKLYLGSGFAPNYLQATFSSSGSTVSELSADALQPGVWQHIVLTIHGYLDGAGANKSLVTVWRNGLPIVRRSLAPIDNVARSVGYLAREVDGTTYPRYDGDMDDVAIYTTALSSARIQAHYQAGTTTGQGALSASVMSPVGQQYRYVVASDIVSEYLHLDDPTGSTTATPIDNRTQEAPAVSSSGVSFQQAGLLGGGTTFQETGPNGSDADRAASFDGSNGYIYWNGTTGHTNPTTSATSSIEAWFKTTGNNEVIVGAGDHIPSSSGSKFVPELYIGSGGSLRGFINTSNQSGDQNYLASTTAVNDGKPHHAVITSDGTTESLYLDGSLVVSHADVATGQSALTNATLGTGYSDGTQLGLTSGWKYFNGTIDEVAFYSSSLSATQVSAHFVAGYGEDSGGTFKRDYVTTTGFAPSTTSGGLPAATPLGLCDAGLGLEPWWTYLSKPAGATSTASVNVANGNLVVSATDSTPVQAHGRLDLVLHRTYNSQDSTLVSAPGSIGAGWQLSVGQSDVLAGAGVTVSGLEVPTVESALSQITSPQDVTVVDRDGTRHLFTPSGTPSLNLTAASLPSALNGLKPVSSVLSLAGINALTGKTYTNLCVDQTYNAPPGVHLGLWRYVAVGGTAGSATACSSINPLSSPAPIVAGFVTERPDRLRTEFNLFGQTVAMSDGAGASLKYVYNGLTAVTPGALAGVYDDVLKTDGTHACTDATYAAGGSLCRHISFTYLTNEIDVTDPAGRITKYKTTGTTRKLLTEVDNPSGSTLAYDYNGQGTTTCGTPATSYQLCDAFDELGHAVRFHYTADNGLLPTGRVDKITDRRSFDTALAYSPAQTTATSSDGSTTRKTVYDKIDTIGRVGQIYAGDGNVTTSTALRTTSFFWDKTSGGASCEQSSETSNPSNGHDNDLCEVIQAGSTNPSTGYSTPDADAVTIYDDAGMPETVVRNAGRDTSKDSDPYITASSGSTIETANGYQRMYFTASGGTSGDEGLQYGSYVSKTSPHITAKKPTAPAAPILFSLSDRTQAAPARAADDATNWQQFLETFTIDRSTSTAPNSSPVTGSCTSAGSATGNTGAICQTSHNFGPVGAAAANPPTTKCPDDSYTKLCAATTINTYDQNGQLATKLTPKANAGGLAAYSYTYFAPTATSLALDDTTPSNGWLAAVSDPTTTPRSHFVAFGYDGAGNVVRTWDRDATDGHQISDYPGTVATPGPGAYSQMLYASSTPDVAKPWRWALSSADPGGHKTTYIVDELGDRTQITSANNNTSFIGYDYEQNPYSRAAAAEHISDPHAITFTTYDGWGEPSSVSSPNQSTAHYSSTMSDPTHDKNVDMANASIVYGYDSVGDRTSTSTVRGGASLLPSPAGSCRVTTGTDTPQFQSNVTVCTSSKGFDSLGNQISSTDAANHTATMAYDALSRQYRNQALSNGTTTPATWTNEDEDGNVVDACSPRELDTAAHEPGASQHCTASSVYATHTTYDLADWAVTTVKHRSTSTTLTSAMVHDADGNTIESCRPRQASEASGGCAASSTYATFATYNVLDRLTASNTPRGGSSNSTYRVYTPAGDVLATVADGLATDNPGGTQTSATKFRVTGYSYDASHRPVDTVQGLQVADSDPTADNDSNRQQIRDIAVATNLVDASDTRNVRTRKGYDSDGNVVALYSPRAFVGGIIPSDHYKITNTYDADNRQIGQYIPRFDTSVTDPTANDTQKNECSSSPPSGTDVTYPVGVHECVTMTNYDADGNATLITPPNAWMSNGSSAPSVVPSAQFSQLFSTDDLLTAVTGPNPAGGSETLHSFTYDPDGRQVADTVPSSQTSPATFSNCTVYNDDGSAAVKLTNTTSSCPNSSSSRHREMLTYDFGGDVTTDTVKAVTVDGTSQDLTTTTSYTADGLKAKVSAPASSTTAGATNDTSYVYDTDGDPTKVTSPNANASDAANTLGLPTVNTYTSDDLLAATYVPVAAITGSTPKWRRTTYGYDPEGDKTQTNTDRGHANVGVTDPTAGSYGITNGTGDVGQQRSFSFDPDGLLDTETGGTSSSETIKHSYDADGNPIQMVDNEPATAGGQVYTNITDGVTVGGATASTAASNYTTTSTFYLDGSTRTVSSGLTSPGSSDAPRRTTEAAYDGAGRLSARASATDASIGSASPTTYSYGDADLPTSASDPTLGNYSWSYWQDGQPKTRTSPGGMSTSWFYTDQDTTLRLMKQATSGGTVKVQDCYTYDEAGKVLTQNASSSVTQPATGTSCASDAISTLTYTYWPSAAVKSFKNGSLTAASYSYDHDSNRLTSADPTGTTHTWTYRADDAINTEVFGAAASVSYGYDSDGRLVGDRCSVYTYDGYDRTAVVGKRSDGAADCSSAQPSVAYGYDGLDRQTLRAESGKPVTAIGYDLLGSTVDSEVDPSASTGSVSVYQHDPDGAALGITHTPTGGSASSQQLGGDGRGSIAAVWDNTGALTCEYRYDPYGNTINANSAGTSLPDGCVTGTGTYGTYNTLTYQSTRTDPTTKDQQYGSRSYDPAKGAFTVPDAYRAAGSDSDLSVHTDPLTANTYTYVNGDPVNYTDPDGHQACETTNSGNYCNGDLTSENKRSRTIATTQVDIRDVAAAISQRAFGSAQKHQLAVQLSYDQAVLKFVPDGGQVCADQQDLGRVTSAGQLSGCLIPRTAPNGQALRPYRPDLVVYDPSGRGSVYAIYEVKPDNSAKYRGRQQLNRNIDALRVALPNARVLSDPPELGPIVTTYGDAPFVVRGDPGRAGLLLYNTLPVPRPRESAPGDEPSPSPSPTPDCIGGGGGLEAAGYCDGFGAPLPDLPPGIPFRIPFELPLPLPVPA